MLRKINQKVLDNLSYVVEQSVTFLVPFIVGINNENAYKNQTKRFKKKKKDIGQQCAIFQHICLLRRMDRLFLMKTRGKVVVPLSVEGECDSHRTH